MQEVRQNACVNIVRGAGPINPSSSPTIAASFVGQMRLECAEHSADLCFDFARATAGISNHGGLSPTAGRARNAANARANVVEVQTFQ
jgi:hypothetical protein